MRPMQGDSRNRTREAPQGGLTCHQAGTTPRQIRPRSPVPVLSAGEQHAKQVIKARKVLYREVVKATDRNAKRGGKHGVGHRLMPFQRDRLKQAVQMINAAS